MSFTILVHPKAKKFTDKLDKEIKERIKNKISELKEFPENRGKPLKYSNFWSLRVGDYRVIYEIDKSNNKVIILFIGHRKNVYDDFSKLF
ncbi:MAG: type II toxin-antitoxin system RelE/ParE family toxin [Candidatus Woesearchaeota archaeon]|nr:MAG: type II toxin-antitoxin system RelE/ParE family toxin [Candidatus Woesearchaeota archaeon]